MAMTRDNIEMIHGYMEALTDLHMEELEKIVSQPSVSTEKDEAASCANMLVNLFHNIGMKAELLESPMNPAVFAEARAKDEQAPTILFYGHYDVNSAESQELWNTPPFRPTVVGGKMYGCGVADNKGSFMAHVMAVQACMEVLGDVPVHVKFLLDGEGACGAPNLAALLNQNSDMLKADLVYVSEGTMHSDTVPQIGCGNAENQSLPIINKVYEAIEKTYGEKPMELKAENSTMQVFAENLHVPTVCVPYANPDSNAHEPNENLNLDCYFNGIHATAQVLYEIAAM